MRLILLSLFMFLPPLASAQVVDPYVPPSVEELQTELFGVHLFGVVDGGEIWNECIETDGDTLYTFGDRQLRGKAWIPEAGKICFTYGDNISHCFAAIRDQDGWVFRGNGTTWQTTQIRDDVDVCLLSDMIG